MKDPQFDLDADLLHLEAMLKRISSVIDAADELEPMAARVQQKLRTMPFEETEEQRYWVASLKNDAELIGDRACRLPTLLWSVSRASLDIHGDLVKSINEVGQ